jgi:hypothetical protein
MECRRVEQNISRLDVPMGDARAVAVLECLGDRSDNAGCTTLVEPPARSGGECRLEVAAIGVLEDKVDMGRVPEKAEKACDGVRMDREGGVYGELAAHEAGVAGYAQAVAWDTLDRDAGARGDVAREEDGVPRAA